MAMLGKLPKPFEPVNASKEKAREAFVKRR